LSKVIKLYHPHGCFRERFDGPPYDILVPAVKGPDWNAWDDLSMPDLAFYSGSVAFEGRHTRERFDRVTPFKVVGQ